MMNQKTAIGYIRVSTEEQVNNGYSLDNQKDDIIAYCKDNDIHLLEVFKDEGLSGAYTQNRLGLARMLKQIDENNINLLVIWSLSRLGRNVRDIVNIVEELKYRGTNIVSIKDNIDTRRTKDKMMVFFNSFFAEIERDNIITQVRAGMHKKATLGEWNGGTPPLGYDCKNKRLVVNQKEAEMIQFIFDCYAEERSLHKVMLRLNKNGLTTKRGKAFSVTSVKNILTNPVYIGKLIWGVKKNSGRNQETGKLTRINNDNPIVVENAHQAIISVDLFNRVNEYIETNPRHKVKQFSGNHILSGLLRCPHCGYGMSAQRVVQGKKTYWYYVCNQYQNKKTCEAGGVNEEKIHAEFYRYFGKLVSNKAFQQKLKADLKQNHHELEHLKKQIASKRIDLKKLEKKKDRYFDELTDDDILFKDEVKKKIKDILGKINKIENAIHTLENEQVALESNYLDEDEIIMLLQNVGKVLPHLEPEAQKKILRSLISEIQLEGKHIKSIRFSFDKNFRVESSSVHRN